MVFGDYLIEEYLIKWLNDYFIFNPIAGYWKAFKIHNSIWIIIGVEVYIYWWYIIYIILYYINNNKYNTKAI